MARFDNLLKRLMGDAKSYERIQTAHGSETMTVTQACRFRELQSTRFEGKRKTGKPKTHYTLKEAAGILKTGVDDILMAAAAGRLQCFVMSKGVRGHWRTTGHGEPRLPAQAAAMPKYLALTRADCRQIAANGSVNVYDLEYPAGPAPDDGTITTTARFILREPMWADRAAVVLQHPLPK